MKKVMIILEFEDRDEVDEVDVKHIQRGYYKITLSDKR
jgi:hypothetical protein